MKKNFWIFAALTALTATTVLAQDTAPAPTAPAPSATAKQAEAKPKKPKATGIKSRVEINPPGNAVVKGNSVNVRGQPSFVGEVLGHLHKGDTATLLEEITLSHPPADEPPKWYKIAMPTNIPAWIKIDYIDPATKAVKVHRVNLRGGPGENYSVVGRLEKGAMLNELRDDKGWVAIEPPTNAYAFVAAELLEIQTAPAPVAAVASTPAPAPEPVAVPPPAAAPVAATPPPAEQPAPAPTPAPVAPPPTAQAETAAEAAALQHATAVTTNAALETEALAPRIVTREGFVHKSHNIQSPTYFELHDIKSGDLIEYLQPQGQQNFKIYVGTRVSITGPEVMDTRWPRTPVLQVQSVELMP
ncbi:MAG TPA: SH3 domain-containing protein [Verrucomicrobiae bacterium]|jgi:uncharacterized protein YgiM (DUF1202 family)